MLKTPIARGVALATLGATLAIPTMAQAAFVEDTKAGLELRNFYFNRDFRQDNLTSANQSKQEEWAQGFILRVESGYTEGTVGFGVDALGLLGVKLYSSEDTAGSGLMPSSFGIWPDCQSEALRNRTQGRYSAAEKPGHRHQRQPAAPSGHARRTTGFQGDQRSDARSRICESYQPPRFDEP